MRADTLEFGCLDGNETAACYQAPEQTPPQHLRPRRRGRRLHRPRHLAPREAQERRTLASRITDVIKPSLIEGEAKHLVDKNGTFDRQGKTLPEMFRNLRGRTSYRIAKGAGIAALMLSGPILLGVDVEQGAQAEGEPVPEKIELEKCLDRPNISFGPKTKVDISPTDQAQLQSFNEDYQEALEFVGGTEELDSVVADWSAPKLLCFTGSDGSEVIINPLYEQRLWENFQAPGAERIADIDPTYSYYQWERGSGFELIVQPEDPIQYSAAA